MNPNKKLQKAYSNYLKKYKNEELDLSDLEVKKNNLSEDIEQLEQQKDKAIEDFKDYLNEMGITGNKIPTAVSEALTSEISFHRNIENDISGIERLLKQEYNGTTTDLGPLYAAFEYQKALKEKILKRNALKKLIDSNSPEKELTLNGKDEVKKRSHAYKGGLTEQCIEDLEKLAEDMPNVGTETFFKAAHTQFESCRKSDTGKSISWSTLRSRTKKRRLDIYNKVATR